MTTMKLRTLLIKRLAMLCLLVSTGFGIPAFCAPPDITKTPTVDLRQAPTGGKSPVVVSLGLYVTNLVAIDEARETFEVAGYIIAKMKLSCTMFDVAPDNGRPRTFKYEDLWTPPIEGSNSVFHKTNAYFLEADKDGLISYVERFDSTLSSGLNLRKFPFDGQTLEFDYQPFASVPSAIRLLRKCCPALNKSGSISGNWLLGGVNLAVV